MKLSRRNSKNNVAFSLVELMVIVVIIGILAVGAVPFYRDHVARAQIASVFPALDAIKTDAYQFYDINGVFPDALRLGMDSPQAQLNDPTTISPLLTDFYVISTAYNDEGYSCTSPFGEIWLFFDPDQVGISDEGFDFGVYIYYAVIDDIFVTTAEDSSESGNEYVKQLVNPDYPDYNALFTAAGCTFS